ENNVTGLSINEVEEKAWHRHDNWRYRKKYLIYDWCDFFSASVVHFLSMKNTLANLWHPLGGVQISNLGEKWYLFRVFNIVDKDRVVKGAPWALNNHLLVFHRLDNSEDPKQDLMVHELEDNPIESLDGKKRPRMSKNITNVSGFMDALGVTDEHFHAYCMGLSAISKGYQESLAYAEIISSPSSLLYGDKIGFVENGKSS
ncbi:hypothetical protein Godav_000952, partial [Gossypium davidsonii]|nr:hypothetical protein [Gossypium davidsonii]